MNDETKAPDLHTISDATGNSGEPAIPEPEEVIEIRAMLADLTERLNRGEVERISIYIENRDGGYIVKQTRGNQSRHEDAGRLMELAIQRLGYVHTSTLPEAEE